MPVKFTRSEPNNITKPLFCITRALIYNIQYEIEGYLRNLNNTTSQKKDLKIMRDSPNPRSLFAESVGVFTLQCVNPGKLINTV
jgi:hypothetical protein